MIKDNFCYACEEPLRLFWLMSKLWTTRIKRNFTRICLEKCEEHPGKVSFPMMIKDVDHSKKVFESLHMFYERSVYWCPKDSTGWYEGFIYTVWESKIRGLIDEYDYQIFPDKPYTGKDIIQWRKRFKIGSHG
eukprot:UN30359